jgi:hypothetical protein
MVGGPGKVGSTHDGHLLNIFGSLSHTHMPDKANYFKSRAVPSIFPRAERDFMTVLWFLMTHTGYESLISN